MKPSYRSGFLNPFLRSVLLTAATLALGIMDTAHAGTYYWDTDGSGTPGFGSASGTWGTSAFWGSDSAGSGATANTSITTADEIHFGTDSAGLLAGTITGPSGQGFLNMTFGSASGAINLSGGTLNLNTTTGSTITVNNASDTISTVLQGTGGKLIKSGTGTLTLSGANTYTGTTTVTKGKLTFASGGSARNSSGFTVESGATLELDAVNVLVAGHGIAVDKNITVNGGTLLMTAYSEARIGNVTLNNGATWTSNRGLTYYDILLANTSTGAATVSVTGNAASLMNGSGGIHLQGQQNFDIADVTNNADADLTVSMVLAGPGTTGGTAGGIVKLGAGTMVLSGANTYTGTTTVSAGALQVGNGSTGSLNGTTGTALTFGGTGKINFNEATSSTQGMGALTFSAGDANIISTAAGASSTATLTFASLAARSPGATGNFALETNTTASQNKIVLTTTTNAPLSSGSNNQGMFFGGTEYARYDTTNGYFRAVKYDVTPDTNASTIVGASSSGIGINDGTKDVKISGAITGQNSAAVNTLNMGANSVTLTDVNQVFSVNGILSAGSSTAQIATAGKLQATAAGNELVIRVNGSGDVLTIAPVIQNNGAGTTASALTKSGAGTLVLSNTANTYTGKTYINGGVLQIANADTALGAAPASAVADQLTLNGGTLQFTGGTALVANRGITLGAAGGTFDTQAFTPSIAGTIAGSGAFTKIGSGKLTLSATHASFTGATIVNQGTLALTAGNGLDSGLYNSSSITINNGGKVEVGGDNALHGYRTTSVGKLTINAGGEMTTTSGVTAWIRGALELNGGTLAANTPDSGYGTWTFGQDVTTINAVTSTMSAGQMNWANGTTRKFTVSDAAGILNVTGTFARPTGFPAIDGGPSFTGSLNKDGLGTMVLRGANTYTGTTTVTQGKLTFASGGSARNSSGFTVESGATLELDAVNVLVADHGTAVNKTITVNGGTLLMTANSESRIGNVTLNNGATWTSNRSLNSYDILLANNTAGAATVAVTGNAASLMNGSGGIHLQGVQNFDVADVTGNANADLTVSMVLAGPGATGGAAGGIVKSGAGTMTLTGANTYSGNTTVQAGTLKLSAASTNNISSSTKIIVGDSLANSGANLDVTGLTSSKLALTASQTLGGHGTVTGGVTAASGSHIAPGNSLGTLAVSNGLTLADGSIFDWEIDRTKTQTRGTGYDALNVTGTLTGLDGADTNTTYDSKFRIIIGDSDFSDGFWKNTMSWTDIFTESNGTTVKSDWVSIFGGGFEYYKTDGTQLATPDASTVGYFTFNGSNNNTLTWTAVPEPTSALAGLLITAGLLRRRRA